MAASIVLTKVLRLPAVADYAVWVVPVHDEFYIWINKPMERRTRQFKVDVSYEFTEQKSLPLIVAGAVWSGRSFILTAADLNGQPVVAETDANGTLLWQQPLECSQPYRWPAPACDRTPLVVWQPEQGRVDVAKVSGKGLAQLGSIAVKGPPLSLAVAEDSLWAVWSDQSGVFAVEANDSGVKHYQLADAYYSEVGAGRCGDGVTMAWARGGSAFLTEKHASAAFRKTVELELGEATGGSLRVVEGDQPLVHAWRGYSDEGETPRVISVVTGPATAGVTIEGLIYSVVNHGGTLVTIGENEMKFFKVEPR
jgi:hypothetical protein